MTCPSWRELFCIYIPTDWHTVIERRIWYWQRGEHLFLKQFSRLEENFASASVQDVILCTEWNIIQFFYRMSLLLEKCFSTVQLNQLSCWRRKFSMESLNFVVVLKAINFHIPQKSCIVFSEKKAIEERRRRGKWLSLRPESLRWRFSRFPLYIDLSILRTMVFSFAASLFRIFFAETGRLTK